MLDLKLGIVQLHVYCHIATIFVAINHMATLIKILQIKYYYCFTNT